MYYFLRVYRKMVILLLWAEIGSLGHQYHRRPVRGCLACDRLSREMPLGSMWSRLCQVDNADCPHARSQALRASRVLRFHHILLAKTNHRPAQIPGVGKQTLVLSVKGYRGILPREEVKNCRHFCN